MPASAFRFSTIPFQLALCALFGVPLVAAAQTTKKPAPDVIKQADAAFREGYAARQDGNLELARNKFAEVVHLQPDIAEGQRSPGRSPGGIGQTHRRRPRVRSRRKIARRTDGIETNLALAYFQAGQNDKAIPHFESAVSLSQQPGHAALEPSFYDAYGHALAAADKPGQAALQFVAEEALTGQRTDLEDAIGTLDAKQANWPEAQQHFERAISPITPILELEFISACFFSHRRTS